MLCSMRKPPSLSIQRSYNDTQVFPLWAITPASTGGLSWVTSDLGIMNAVAGGMVVGIQLFIYHRVAKRLVRALPRNPNTRTKLI